MSMKNPSDTIEPATFWLVAQCFNQLRHVERICVFFYVYDKDLGTAVENIVMT
jgi:hypothetical protein